MILGTPQNNSISTVNTLRIYGCDGFLDAKIANNTRRIEVSGQLYTLEALHGLLLFGDLSVMVVKGFDNATYCMSIACKSRGSHRSVPCTSSCDGDQSEIKRSSTQASSDQGIKMVFRPQIRSKSK